MTTEANPILILVLQNGDQLLAETEEQQGVYLCTNVLQIVTDVDTQSGQMRMGMMPYLPFADPNGGVAIPSNLAIIAIPTEELVNHYSEKFGKIITPSSKIIL